MRRSAARHVMPTSSSKRRTSVRDASPTSPAISSMLGFPERRSSVSASARRSSADLPAGLQAAVGCSASAHVAAISAPNIACPYARRRPLQTGGGLDSADSVQYSSATRSGDFNNRLPSPNCQSRTTHDALPRFVTVSDPLTALTSTYTYDYAGRTDTVVTGGATRKYTYDRMGRNLTDTNQSTVGATAVLSTTNEWDNADRLTKRTTGPVGVAGAGAGVETFGYDQASRLKSWTYQANVTTPYTWSAASNRTAAGANTFTYNERNQLTTQTVAGTTSTYTYQPNGALASTITGAVTTARNYDGLGRQTLVGATSYTYDALGRLTGAGSNTLGYAGLEQEPVVDNAVLYTRTPNGTINASKTGVTAALVTTNIHGDIAATINPTTGTVTGRRTYDPTGVPILTTTVGNTGYQAQYTDPATAEIHTQTRN